MEKTPSGQRVHIGFFGCRNAGKSSLVNAVTGQPLSIVSPMEGTTTDPVHKAMELLPLGPVVIIDTPGMDDVGDLGALRIQRTTQILQKVDCAVLVIDALRGKTPPDEAFIMSFQTQSIPYLIVYNKADLITDVPIQTEENSIYVSATTGFQIALLKNRIAAAAKPEPPQPLISDLLSPSDLVVLVTPIDSSAPKGRMILPQQQVLRDVLDADAVSIVTKETQLLAALAVMTQPPRMVITDSQIFHQVAAMLPTHIPLTSFSILMARHKGFLETAYRSVAALSQLQDGARILICESCTHHRQCKDIGTVKLPQWLSAHTKKKLEFSFTSGTHFPDELTDFDFIVHCGGCMATKREVQNRMSRAVQQNIPFTNYGVLIAYMQGILDRCVTVFPDLLSKF